MDTPKTLTVMLRTRKIPCAFQVLPSLILPSGSVSFLFPPITYPDFDGRIIHLPHSAVILRGPDPSLCCDNLLSASLSTLSPVLSGTVRRPSYLQTADVRALFT